MDNGQWIMDNVQWIMNNLNGKPFIIIHYPLSIVH